MPIIYLDNAATTSVSPQVKAAMEPYFADVYGNPSSVHQAGRTAKAAVEAAREKIARALHATAQEIVFTSGGTEADNAAIIGIALAHKERGKHIITSSMEHHAVLSTCAFLEEMGYEVTYVNPGNDGIVSVEDVERAIRPDTILLSVMTVNNETGAIQPIRELGALTREREIVFHTDAVQAVGLLPIDVQEMGIDLLSMSGHKLHGPKGIGALYVRDKLKWTPFQHGGNQERQRRGGTENLAGIVGIGAATEIAMQEQEQNVAHIRQLRATMLEMLHTDLPNVVVNSPEHSLPSILNVTFTGVSAERVLMNLDIAGVMAASGSACTSGSLQPSHVLMAMGCTEEHVRSAIRFSFSGHNTLDEVTEAARKTVQVVQRLLQRA
ncbi:MAG: cysteine desulfurase family protein [Tumebacillaceae bacterium]